MSSMPSIPEPGQAPVIAPGHSLSSVTDKITSIVLRRHTPRGWYIGLGFAFLFVMMLQASASGV